MNVSPSSNSVTTKATSLLDPSSSAAKTEEGGESKGFFASLKDALGLGEEAKAETSKVSKNTDSSDQAKVASDSSEAGEAKKSDKTESSDKPADAAKKVDSDTQSASSKPVTHSDEAISKAQQVQASGDKPTQGRHSEETDELSESKAAKINSTQALTKAEATEQAGANKLQATSESAQRTQTAESNKSVQQVSPEQSSAQKAQGTAAGSNANEATKATAAMSEGNKLLGQLDEANKTLQASTNGKALPQTDAVTIAGFNAQSSQAIKSELASKDALAANQLNPQSISPQALAGAQSAPHMTMVGASGAQVIAEGGEMVQGKVSANPQSNSEQAALEQKVAALTHGVPVSQLNEMQLQQLMQQGVTPQQIEQLANAEQSVASTSPQQVAGLTQAATLTQEDLELAAEVEMRTQAINQLNKQIDATEAVVSELEAKQVSGESLTEDEKATLMKASTELQVLQQQRSQLTEQASQLYSQAPAAINWDAPADAPEVTSGSVEEWAATAAVAGAAHQAVQQSAVADKAQAALAQSNQAQAVQMQQAQQLAAHQASNAAAAQATTPMTSSDLDLAAAQNVAVSSMNTEILAAKAGSKDALLKAGAGAAALAGLGRTTGKDDAKESSFAQQIASAAGVQGSAPIGSAPTRAEIQAAQQAPLQLTKELANEQVAEKVQMMMSKNLKNLDIRLDPPELGQMKIRMTMNNDVANVHFTVTNQQARDVIEQTLPRLREMLAQQGMQLADSSVQQQSTGQGQDRYNSGEGSGQSGSGSANDGQGDENLDSSSNLELNVASKRDGISYYA